MPRRHLRQSPSHRYPRNGKLTGKERAFIDFYIANGFNSRQAAISVGFSPKNADVRGGEYRTRERVKQAIELRIKALGFSEEMLREKLMTFIDSPIPAVALRAIELSMKFLHIGEEAPQMVQLPPLIVVADGEPSANNIQKILEEKPPFMPKTRLSPPKQRIIPETAWDFIDNIPLERETEMIFDEKSADGEMPKE